MQLVIRPETLSDYASIAHVNNLAFGQAAESRLVEKLRLNPVFNPALSLVAEYKDAIIGHILFFPVRVVNGTIRHPSLALAPMSVMPGYQTLGIGGKLILNGLHSARKLGYRSVVVLGHKEYYPRFGFLPAAKWGIKAPFNVPDDAFMAIELVPGGLQNVSGTVVYPEEFGEVC